MYNWRNLDAKSKQPTFVHFSDDRPFGLAGIWERWKPDGNTEPVDTVCIITTTPNDVMKPNHDRMPVILRPTSWSRSHA